MILVNLVLVHTLFLIVLALCGDAINLMGELGTDLGFFFFLFFLMLLFFRFKLQQAGHYRASYKTAESQNLGPSSISLILFYFRFLQIFEGIKKAHSCLFVSLVAGRGEQSNAIDPLEPNLI